MADHLKHLLFFPLLILLLYPAVCAIDSIQLPVFTTSEDKIRPSEISNVLAQSGEQKYLHSHVCGDQQEWKLWAPDKTNKTKYINEKVDIGCNHDQTIIGFGSSPVGSSCMTFLTCDNLKCTKPVEVIPERTIQPAYKSVDPLCFLHQQSNQKFQHAWGNAETKLKELTKKIPHGAEATTNDIYLLMPTRERNDSIHSSRKFLAHFLWSGKGGPLDLELKKSEDYKNNAFKCNDGCKYGKHMLINYNETSKTMHVYLRPTCSWFTVCTDWKEGSCKSGATVNIMPRNGFVAFDSRKEQVPIRLIRETEKQKGTVRIDLTILSSKATGGSFAQLSVTSMFRQQVSGGVNIGNKMMMSFSSPECLDPKFGLRAQTSQVYVLFGKHDDGTYKKKVEEENKDNNEVDKEIQVEHADGDAIIEPIPNITKEDTDISVGETTTEMPQGKYDAYILSVAPHKQLFDGYATWGIFFGWLLGSILAFALMAPIMYFCRRSIYNCWYRGMYKRYGCDASGTTGGMTDVFFSGTTGNSQITLKSQMDSQASKVISEMTTNTAGGNTKTTAGTSIMTM